MAFNPEAPLHRIKNETQKSHDAFMDYFLMGSGRSFQKLIDRYKKQWRIRDELGAKMPPTKELNTLGNWSSKFHWQARVAHQTEIDNDIFLEQYRKRYMSKEEVIAILSDQARGDMGDFANVRAQADLADNQYSALIKTITQHYIQTSRGEGDRAQTEIKARITLGLYDAQKALELLAKHYGLFDADNKRQNLNIDLDKLTDGQLERIVSGEDILSVISDSG